MEDDPNQKIPVFDGVDVDGGDLTDAGPATTSRPGDGGELHLQLLGARRFADITRANVGRRFAIVLDNKVISAPVIREPILGGAVRSAATSPLPPPPTLPCCCAPAPAGPADGGGAEQHRRTGA